MIPRRKLKSFLVPPDQIALALRAPTAPERPLPDDSEFVFGHWNANFGAFELVFHSESFDEVPAGTPIPLSMNGPTLLEAG